MFRFSDQLTNDYLTDIFRGSKVLLDSNLADLSGNAMIELDEVLNLPAARINAVNVTILETILWEDMFAFRNAREVNEVLKNPGAVPKALTILGTNSHRNLRWLIDVLHKLGEKVPLSKIIQTGPPKINRLCGSRINPGGIVKYEVSTISKAEVKWIKYTDVVRGPIRLEGFLTQVLTYQTNENDNGWFRIEVDCPGFPIIRSEIVYVGACDNPGFIMPKVETQLIDPIINCTDGINRVALLFGIMDYTVEENQFINLKAPKTDIRDLDRTLRKIGFKVYCFSDAPVRKFMNVLTRFADTFTDEKSYVFFYFAGHGKYEDNKDHIVLKSRFGPKATPVYIDIYKVIEKLQSKTPKLLVTIFDMCRFDEKHQQSPDKTVEAKLPTSENLLLVMSTFPFKRAYELKKIKLPQYCENVSQIIPALCAALENYACKETVNITMQHFSNDKSITRQKPIITNGPMQNIILGNETEFPRLYSLTSTVEELEDMKFLSVDFEDFYNVISVCITNSNYSLRKSECIIQKDKDNHSVEFYCINLFDESTIVNNQTIILDVFKPDKFFKLEIKIPKEILDFYLENNRPK